MRSASRNSLGYTRWLSRDVQLSVQMMRRLGIFLTRSISLSLKRRNSHPRITCHSRFLLFWGSQVWAKLSRSTLMDSKWWIKLIRTLPSLSHYSLTARTTQERMFRRYTIISRISKKIDKKSFYLTIGIIFIFKKSKTFLNSSR